MLEALSHPKVLEWQVAQIPARAIGGRDRMGIERQLFLAGPCPGDPGSSPMPTARLLPRLPPEPIAAGRCGIP
jgi:hypothetical protein